MGDKNERDLEEVERALSVLGGRHPNQVRAEREANEAAARRAKEHEVRAEGDRRRTIKRAVIACALVAGLGGIGFGVWRFFSARAAIDAQMAPLVAPFTAAGFDAIPRGTFAARDRAELTTLPGDCYAFVAAGDAQMRIERPVGTAGAKGNAIVCTCATENVVVTAGGAPVRALHIAGGALGGSHALAYRFSGHVPTAIAGDDACADDALASFARDKHYGKQERDGAWLASHAAFASSGFTTLASAPEKLPYVFVEPSASCFVAVAPHAELVLWALGADVQKPLHGKDAIAWCAAKPAGFVVERMGAGTTTVVSVPSARIGGMIGLREIAARGNVTIATWVRDEERGEIAADALRASVVPDPVAIGSQTIDAAQTKDARVLAFSTATSFAPSEADFRCAPALGEPDALCVQLRALTWHAPPPAVVCGAAYGALPFWMSALADLHESAVVDAELALVGFARRMSARGFSPTVIEGVTEREGSVEVLGRSGDDAIVAVGLWPAAPYIHPYSDDSPWTLDDAEPRIIPLKTAGERVSLPVHPAGVPVEKRRTVVFRHSLSG